MNALELAEFLESHAAKATTSLTCNESKFISAAKELRRLFAIEQAATALIKCRGRYNAELNTKALADALSITLPLAISVDSTRPSVNPEFPWHSVSIDVSTCESDANNRIFANITGWVDGTILAEKTSQNFDFQLPVFAGDIVEYSHEGMGCGLEDRGITDRYDAMQYGWDEAIDSIDRQGPFYFANPMENTTVPEVK